MRLLIIVTSGMLLTLSSFAQGNNFIIDLKVDSLENGKTYPLRFRITNSVKKDTLFYADTLSASKNRITIKGYVREEFLTNLSIKGFRMFTCCIGPNDSIFIRLVRDKFPEWYEIHGSISPVVMANYFNKHFLTMAQSLLDAKSKIDSLYINFKDSLLFKKAKVDYDKLYDSCFKFNIAFCDTTPSPTSIYFALHRYFGAESKYDIYPSIEKALSRFNDCFPIKLLEKDYEAYKLSPTTLSKDDTLSFLGFFEPKDQKTIHKKIGSKNLILIDFWASWCGLCREEFPFLNAAYKEFKNKGFEIISISFDEKKEAWSKAWASSKNNWKLNFLDKKGWQSPTVKQLNIKSIPRNYLIDANGKIYAKDLRGTELIETLRKLL